MHGRPGGQISGRFHLGGNLQQLLDKLSTIEAHSAILDLSLNRTKCEVVGRIVIPLLLFSFGLGPSDCPFRRNHSIGLPLFPLDKILTERSADLCHMPDRLGYLSSHEWLFLLSSTLAVPTLFLS